MLQLKEFNSFLFAHGKTRAWNCSLKLNVIPFLSRKWFVQQEAAMGYNHSLVLDRPSTKGSRKRLKIGSSFCWF